MKTLHQDHPYSYSTRKLPNHTDEGYRKIIEIGQKNGIRSALHEPLLSGFKKGVNLGFHTLEHMPMDSVIPDHYVDKFMKQDMAMMPTIMIYGDNFKKKEIRNLIDKSGEQYLMPEAIKQMSTRINYRSTNQGKPLSKEEYDKLQFDPKYNHDMFPNVMVNLKKLHEMGATVGAGSDIGGTATGFFGRFTDELRHYAEVGISNFEILKMATSSNARIIGMQDSIGTLKKGSTADIIAVNGNPLERLDALDDIKIVMKGGVIIKNNGVNLGSV